MIERFQSLKVNEKESWRTDYFFRKNRNEHTKKRVNCGKKPLVG